MRTIGRSVLLFSLQLMLAAVASAQSTLQFTDLEHRLLEAEALSLEFRVIATGAVQVNIEGSLGKTATGDISLIASGVFAGQDVDVVAIRNGQTLEYGSRNAPLTIQAPEALWEALVIGFTRMGILHNIANLTADAQPDHADGGVADWVVVHNVEKNEQSFTFDIIVSGTPSGSATLALGGSGDPESRQQTVTFPGGEMKVVETYTNIIWGE